MPDNSKTPGNDGKEGFHVPAGTFNYMAGSPPSRSINFKHLLILFLLLAGLIPGMLGLVGIYRASEKELVKSKGLYFMQVASLTAYQVEAILDDKIRAIKRLSRLPTVQNIINLAPGNKAKEIENLRKIIMPELAREYFIANIFNLKGKEVFHTEAEQTLSPKQLSKQKNHPPVNLRNGIYISGIMESPGNTDQYYIEMYAPVRNYNGVYIGYIQARYALDLMFKTITNVRIGETGHANLLTSEGYIIVCPIYPPKSHKIKSGLLGVVASGKQGWTIADDDAHGASGSVVGYAPVNMYKSHLAPGSFGGEQWYVFTRQEPAETFESIKRFQRKAVVYAIAITALVAAFGFFAWRLILRSQKAYQAEVVHNEKAESIKHLMAGFHQLMFHPLEEFGKLIDEIENQQAPPMSAPQGKTNGKIRPARIRKIRRRLLTVTSLVKHLAYYTQAQSFHTEPVDLARLVDDSLTILEFLIAGKGIEVKVDKPAEPITLMGQPKLLNIVIMNIMLNAIQSMDGKGKMKISMERSGKWGVCVIQDNGSGIPKEKMDDIFEPFFTTKKGHKGFGLGLSVSRGITEKHEGVISVRSSEGYGTQVTVKLKLAITPDDAISGT